MGKCRLCELHQSIETDCLSFTKGILALFNPTNNVMMINTPTEEFLFSIRYCPYCGKKYADRV